MRETNNFISFLWSLFKSQKPGFFMDYTQTFLHRYFSFTLLEDKLEMRLK